MCHLCHHCVRNSHLPHQACVQHLQAGITFLSAESKQHIYFNTGWSLRSNHDCCHTWTCSWRRSCQIHLNVWWWSGRWHFPSSGMSWYHKNYQGSNASWFQVSALCNGVTGSISPYVVLSSQNNTNVNAQYHDFRAFTNDSRPDWYFEQMVVMRYTACVLLAILLRKSGTWWVLAIL